MKRWIILLSMLALIGSAAAERLNSADGCSSDGVSLLSLRNPFFSQKISGGVVPCILFLNVTYPLDNSTHYKNTLNVTLNVSSDVDYCTYQINGGGINLWADCGNLSHKLITFPTGYMTLSVVAYKGSCTQSSVVHFLNYGDFSPSLDFKIYFILWFTALVFTVLSYYADNNMAFPAVAVIGWFILALNTVLITYHGFGVSGFEQKTVMAGDPNFGGAMLTPLVYYWDIIGIAMLMLLLGWTLMQKFKKQGGAV